MTVLGRLFEGNVIKQVSCVSGAGQPRYQHTNWGRVCFQTSDVFIGSTQFLAVVRLRVSASCWLSAEDHLSPFINCLL